MKHEFKQEGNWILPVEGTLGNKAKNLYENREMIDMLDFKMPRSLVIPYEYMRFEGAFYYMIDWMQEHFPGHKKVVVRSNAPDEDVGYREPGKYVSRILEDIHDNRTVYDPLNQALFAPVFAVCSMVKVLIIHAIPDLFHGMVVKEHT